MTRPITLFLVCITLVSIQCRSALGWTNIYPKPVKLDHPPGDDVGDPLILTPLLMNGSIKEARKLARVTNLTSVISYSGYFTVNPIFESNTFFWFFPAAFNPDTAPVLVWLQGGPGVSSLLGLFNENGPFVVDSSNNINFRNTAWTLTHSVLYIDNPVGTGYSFTKDDRGYAQNQKNIADDLYSALLQFYLMFPKYQPNDLYITGESYAGKYVPAIAYKIHHENIEAAVKINLKGIAIGDGFSDPISMLNYGDYLYNIGMLDYQNKLYFDRQEGKAKELILQGKYLDAFHLMDKLLLGWNDKPSYYEQLTGFKRYYNYLLSHEPPEMNYYSSFLQQDSTRKSIHVGNISYINGTETGVVEKNLQSDIFKSVKPWIEELLNASQSYKVLMYSGQLDIIVASTLTDKFIQSLQWKGATEFSKAQRKIWKVGKDIAGYSKTVGSFTQLLVRNAGHIVPFDQPEWSFDMINRFTAGKAF